MASPINTELDRFRFWQGQELRSHDFQELERVEDQRRWWHNRALHNSYGVIEGLQCELVPATGKATGVSIRAGLAYDTFGRELILEQPLIIPLPASLSKSQTVVNLWMRLRSDPPSKGIVRACCSHSRSRHAGALEFAWIAANMGSGIESSYGIALCEVKYGSHVVGGVLIKDISVRARPEALPLLQTGTTVPGGTPWEPWIEGFTNDQFNNSVPNVFGVQTWVDTSAAGFTRVPCYFASLQGSLYDPASLPRRLVPAIFPSITQESTTGFMFRLWLQVILPPQFEIELLRSTTSRTVRSAMSRTLRYVTLPSEFALYAQQHELYVSWIGCQMRPKPSPCDVAEPNARLGFKSLISLVPLEPR